tara:strand:+ start:1475 stop:1624 length:150 start_codon:yes stop_codon:yes gene_type:complete
MTEIEHLECEIKETEIEVRRSIEETERLKKRLTHLIIKLVKMVDEGQEK